MRSQIPAAPTTWTHCLPQMQEGGTPGPRMCSSSTPANAEQLGKWEALGVVGPTPEGLTKAMSDDTSGLNVNGQTLEGITGEANLSSMERPESTTVLPVTAIATVRTPQEVIPSLSQQDLREAQLADPNLTEILKAKEAGTAPPLDTTRTGHGVEMTHLTLEPTKGERWSFVARV